MRLRLPSVLSVRCRPLPPGARGRILFLSPFNGGIGGAERLTRTFANWVEGSGYSATMVCRHVLPPGPFAVEESEHLRVLDARHWGRALEDAEWDFVYAIPTEFETSKWVARIERCRGPKVVLEMDCDSRLTKLADVLHVEVARDRALPRPHVVATPDPRPTMVVSDEASDVGDYVLTVFNPYNDEKGHRHIPAFLKGTGRRLIWCYDPTTFAHQGEDRARAMRSRVDAARHPLLEIVTAPSREVLDSLYRGAGGYVCFSDREGLGWALLDALALDLPVASRRVGICRALDGFEATNDFGQPVFKRYPMPATEGFEALFRDAADILGHGRRAQEVCGS